MSTRENETVKKSTHTNWARKREGTKGRDGWMEIKTIFAIGNSWIFNFEILENKMSVPKKRTLTHILNVDGKKSSHIFWMAHTYHSLPNAYTSISMFHPEFGFNVSVCVWVYFFYYFLYSTFIEVLESCLFVDFIGKLQHVKYRKLNVEKCLNRYEAKKNTHTHSKFFYLNLCFIIWLPFIAYRTMCMVVNECIRCDIFGWLFIRCVFVSWGIVYIC